MPDVIAPPLPVCVTVSKNRSAHHPQAGPVREFIEGREVPPTARSSDPGAREQRIAPAFGAAHRPADADLFSPGSSEEPVTESGRGACGEYSIPVGGQTFGRRRARADVSVHGQFMPRTMSTQSFLSPWSIRARAARHYFIIDQHERTPSVD